MRRFAIVTAALLALPNGARAPELRPEDGAPVAPRILAELSARLRHDGFARLSEAIGADHR